MADSVIPGSDGMTVEQDILLKMEDDGSFTAAAPAIVARVANSAIPDLAVAVKMAVEGQLSALPELTPEGIAIRINAVKVLESQYTIAGDGLATGTGKGADISIVVAPLVDELIARIVGAGFLDYCSNGDDQILTFTTGPDFKQVFKRPAPFARMHSLKFLNSLVMHRNVPAFGDELDWNKIGLRKRGRDDRECRAALVGDEQPSRTLSARRNRDRRSRDRTEGRNPVQAVRHRPRPLGSGDRHLCRQRPEISVFRKRRNRHDRRTPETDAACETAAPAGSHHPIYHAAALEYLSARNRHHGAASNNRAPEGSRGRTASMRAMRRRSPNCRTASPIRLPKAASRC